MLTLTKLLILAAMQVNMTGRSESATSAPDSAILFPSVEGTNLEGRRFRLPEDFEADANIVLIAFKREQQKNVDTWIPALQKIVAQHKAVRVYELPTLRRSFRFMRPIIDGGMSRGIPSRATREATITLYIDKTPFKRTLGIKTEDVICVLLVSKAGRVLWRVDGDYNEGAAASLDHQISRDF